MQSLQSILQASRTPVRRNSRRRRWKIATLIANTLTLIYIKEELLKKASKKERNLLEIALMILPIERKEILTILVNKKWIQRKKDTISAEYDERKVFSYLKKKRRRKKKILKVTRPFTLLPPKPTHTQKKIKARPPRCISGFIMGNNQKMPLNSWTCLFFPVLIWITKKKTLLYYS